MMVAEADNVGDEAVEIAGDTGKEDDHCRENGNGGDG